MKLQPLIQNISNTEHKQYLMSKYNKLLNDYLELKNEIILLNKSEQLINLINSLDSKFNLKAIIYTNNIIVKHKEKSGTTTYYLSKSDISFIKLLEQFLLQFNTIEDYNKIKQIINLIKYN